MGIQRIGTCPQIPGHPNCEPVFVHTVNPDLIASVLRIKREAEPQHCRKEKRHG